MLRTYTYTDPHTSHEVLKLEAHDLEAADAAAEDLGYNPLDLDLYISIPEKTDED